MLEMILRNRLLVPFLTGLFLIACESDDNLPLQNPDFVQDVAINIETAVVNGSFTLNTGAFPASYFQRGAIMLRDSQSDALTLLGETWEGGYPQTMIIRGGYDADYGRIDGSLVPQNFLVTASPGHAIDMDQTFDVDVPRSIVVPNFTLNGGAFPASVYDSAELFLRPIGTEELISLGTTHSQPAENVMVVPGAYDVIYSIREGDQLPQNEFSVVMRRVDIASTPHVLNVDIEAMSFDGSWRLAVDGVIGEFPGSIYQRGEFSLRNDFGDEVQLGPSHSSAGPVAVITGTYDVVYSHLDGDLVPQNQGKVISPDLVLPPGLLITEGVVNAWTVTPDFSLDGGALPQSVYESAEILVLDVDTNALTSLGRTHNPPASTMLIDGSYNAVYHYVDGSTIPQNDSAVLGLNLLVDQADAPVSINVDSATVTGNFSMDGEAFVSSVYETADIFLYRDGDGTGILLGKTYSDPEPVVIVAGSYDIVYQHIDGEIIPQNSHHVLIGNQVYNSDGAIDVNVATRQVRPAFTLDGQPFPASVYEHADFYLLGNHPDDYVLIGSSSGAVEDTVVIQSSYDAIYWYLQGENIPVNNKAIVGQIQVD